MATKGLLLSFLSLLFSVLLTGCGQNPRIDVTPEIQGGRTVFNIAASGINSILGFAVMDGTRVLWEIDLSSEKATTIVYGVLPTGGRMAAEQKFPSFPAVPPPIDGKFITVRVDYQYDSNFAACMGQFEKTMQIPSGDPTPSDGDKLSN